MFILNANEPGRTGDPYLKQQKWIQDGETIVSVSKLRGNMNCVLRIETPARFLLLNNPEAMSKIPADTRLPNGTYRRGFYEK
jgi:5-methylthioribose kinase